MARCTHLFAAFLFCITCLIGKVQSQEKSQSLEEIFSQFNLEERERLQQALKNLQPQKLQSLLARFKNSTPAALPFLAGQGSNAVFTDLEFSLPDGIEKVDFGDYDGDGDDDVLITGNGIARVYRNENGRLINLNAGLVGVRFSAAAWGDMDNDRDLDIVITGLDADSTVIAKVYRNDNGTSNDINAGIIGVYFGSVEWGDYDNDRDLDILITGRTDTTRNAIQRISRVYRNDGGFFTPQNFNLAGVMSGAAIWGDYSGDGLLDILITGSSDSTRITKLYRNVGNDFIEDILSLDLPAISSSSVAWKDYDKDNRLDLLMTGSAIINSRVQTISRLYKNEGTRFTEIPAGFINALDPVAWGDYNNDGYADALIGQNLYRNEGGTGVFTRIAIFVNMTTHAVDWGNYNNDGKPDILIARAVGTSYTAVLQNDGNDSFSEAIPMGSTFGSIDLGDYDNDGDLDILLGSFGAYKIYRNDGGRLANINAGLAKNGDTFARWGDYDNDGDLDIALMTSTGAKIYRNLGGGAFVDAQTNLGTNSNGHTLYWGDYDNDGDLDLLITTSVGSAVYRNDRSEFVKIQDNLPADAHWSRSGGWGDFDNDGDPDILITGVWNSWIFRNDNGLFVDIEAGLPGSSLLGFFGATEWGDYDNDGDLDILIAGDGVTRVFRNDKGNFVDLRANLVAAIAGFGQWGDYDNDGDPDILVVGSEPEDLTAVFAKIYRNDNGSFTDAGAALVGSAGGDIAWGDFDGDGDLDILWTGSNGFFEANFKIYRNDTNNPNQPPTAPRNLKVEPVGSAVVLSWDSATDNTTPRDGLTYNVRVSTTSGGVNIKSPMANLLNGQRRVVAMGNANHATNYPLRKLTPGAKYYWGVQALDHAFAGSRFSTEGGFRAPDFAAVLSVSDATNKSIVLVYGTAPNASDGFDADYDEFLPPRSPFGFDARFVKNNLELRKDFRATLVDSIVWDIEIRTAALPMTLRWDSAHFPFSGGFRLKAEFADSIFHDVNMRAQDSLVTNLPRLKIIYTPKTTIPVAVDAGWNLVALPLAVDNSHYLTLFPTAQLGTLFAYENGRYVIKNSLETCRGYWLRFSQPGSVSVEGTAFDNCTDSLTAGWNLIAGPSCGVPVSRISDPGNVIIRGTIFGFDNGVYFPAETIEPGNGYWVRASQAGQITLNCGTSNLSKSAENAITSLPVQEDQYSRLHISDATGATQMLYITDAFVKPNTKLSYSLPPIPPAGPFDVRFADDYRLNDKNEASIRIQATAFPLTLRAENLPAGGEYQYVIQEMAGAEVGKSYILEEGASIKITNRKTTLLKLSRISAVPTTFSLEQNYPNPFNPTTEIHYSIPQNARVSLIIYNTLGQKVRTLVAAPQAAGSYVVSWDGRNDAGERIASGLFIYQLKAGDRVATKKMLMMK